MKIGCLVGSQLNGGAAKGAINFVKALRKENLSVDVIHNDYSNLDFETYIGYNSSFLQKIQKNIDRLVTLNYFKKKSEIFTTGIFSQPKAVKTLNSYDVIIVNLMAHSILSIKSLKNLKCRKIFLMRDDWLITGGCHYVADCPNFIKNCSNCPKVPFYLKNYVNKIKLLKNEILISDSIEVFSINKLMCDENKIKFLYNLINPKFFKKKLIQNREYVVTSAANWRNRWKGYNLLKSIVNHPKMKNLNFVIVGKNSNFNDFKHNNVTLINKTDNFDDYVEIIGKAKLFIMPSEYDYFPKVSCEAIALGVPVVGYAQTGIISYVIDKINGKTVQNYETENFIECILKSLNTNWDANKIRESVRIFSADKSNFNFRNLSNYECSWPG